MLEVLSSTAERFVSTTLLFSTLQPNNGVQQTLDLTELSPSSSGILEKLPLSVPSQLVLVQTTRVTPSNKLHSGTERDGEDFWLDMASPSLMLILVALFLHVLSTSVQTMSRMH